MLIVLMLISIAVIGLGFIVINKSYDMEIMGSIIISIGVVGLLAVILALGIVTSEYISNRNIDDKIAMYQEENKKIEEKIEVTVKQYMDFEKDTYKNLKVDTYINLVSLYPELKSDTLIKEQIKTYQKNNDKIKDLKLAKIDQKARKWWLFFGR